MNKHSKKDMSGAGESRILVVDDEEVMGYLIQRVLSDSEFILDWVQDCESALDKISNQDYDVIISDYKLPGMTGEKFYHRILAFDSSLARRMIFITGDTLNRDINAFFKETELPYFAKPFEIDALKGAIRKVIASGQNPS